MKREGSEVGRGAELAQAPSAHRVLPLSSVPRASNQGWTPPKEPTLQWTNNSALGQGGITRMLTGEDVSLGPRGATTWGHPQETCH